MDKNTYMVRYIPIGYSNIPHFEMLKVLKAEDLWKVASGLLMFSNEIEIIPLSNFIKGEKND